MAATDMAELLAADGHTLAHRRIASALRRCPDPTAAEHALACLALACVLCAAAAWAQEGTYSEDEVSRAAERFFGNAAERALFEAMAEEMLIRAGVDYQRIAGSWDEREAAVREAISAGRVAAFARDFLARRQAPAPVA